MSRRSVQAPGGDAALDAVFSALSDRTRRRILTRLSQSPATVGELAAPFAISLPAVSKHIRILERAGLLRRERDGWYHHCTFDGGALEPAGAFLDRYRSFWEGTLASLARYVKPRREFDRPARAGAKPTRRRAPRGGGRSA